MTPLAKTYCNRIKFNQLNQAMKAAQTRRTYYQGLTEQMEAANERAKQKRKQNKTN